jgi:hypothetical protein
MKNNSPRVAVIGAGCSGITTIKNLLQAGVAEVVCYEQNHEVGGNWLYSPQLSHSSVCETTHIISSKTLSSYEDFPMPEDYPDYPSHEQVLTYFQAYARHFGLYPYIRFNTRVTAAKLLDDQRWQLEVEGSKTEIFDYLFVANGHHNIPRHPEDIKAAFTGRYLHAHAYKTNEPFKDERVLVVGAGNSGCDCAVEISRVASHVGISIRRAQYIIPKFFLGRPTDTFNKALTYLPRPIARVFRALTLKMMVGRYEDYQLPVPDFPVTAAHPTLNSELLYKIRHGKVHPRQGIARIEEKTVTFKDGKQEEYDTILAATGYRISLPFFAKDFINYEEVDRVPLYLRMFHPAHPSLVFIGLFQPQGAVWPLSDFQAKLAANYVMGRWQLPANLPALAEKDSDFIAREFTRSQRHTIEVHYHEFRTRLLREIPQGVPEWMEVERV